MKEIILINISGEDKAGLGIAFHAKPKVKDAAQSALSTVGLDGILYFLGFRDVHLG